MLSSVVLPSRKPAAADPALERLYRHWRDRLLPDYHQLTDLPVDDRPMRELPAQIEQAITTASSHFWYLAVVGGASWKMEHALRRFMEQHRLDNADGARPLSELTPSRGADWYAGCISLV